MKIIIKFFILLTIIFIAIILSLFLFLNTSPNNTPHNNFEFQIKEGTSASALSLDLKKNKIIRSDLFFKLITRITGMDKKIKTGFIAITPGMKTTEIISKILHADFITVTITIPEGYSLKEINKLLISKGMTTDEEVKKIISDKTRLSYYGLEKYPGLEGFLFPETYTFQKGTSLNIIYKTMVKLFFKTLSSTYPEWEKLNSDVLYEKLIIASIIEKEVRNPQEAPIVSAVFYNRLKSKMKLQSCATVQYIFERPKERLLFDDLLTPSPYNTYINEGLPPGPIANPGINSLKAAFNPDKNDYLYFVVKDPMRGIHFFSSDYQEHLKAQERYKSIQGFN